MAITPEALFGSDGFIRKSKIYWCKWFMASLYQIKPWLKSLYSWRSQNY